MPLMPIDPAPGLDLSSSPYAGSKDASQMAQGGTIRTGQGRWVDGQNVEFVAGYAQKIAGWIQASSSTTTGKPRAVKIWRDSNGAPRVGIGTETHLYAMLAGVLTDITPLRTISSGTLAGPFTTTAGSVLVVVTDATQALVNGDWVYLSAASAVGGVTINGWYSISARSGAGYTITVGTAAASSTSGGGTTAYSYPRVTLTSPFTTTSGSATVKVTHNSHGALAGNYVSYSGASTIGGLTINGEYVVASVIDANNYNITASSTAGSSTTGGGSVSVFYLIVVQQNTSTSGIGWGVGAWGAGAWGYGITSVPVLANGWTLDAYGNQLMAAPIGGTIYVFNPVFGGRAYPLLNAPSSMNAMFVTPERFVVALGINNNLMQIAWCDQSDYTVWTTTATNTANTGRTLIGGSYMTGGISLRNGVSLIFSDRCVFEMTYIGSNEIYSTLQQGDNCGLIDPTAVCVEGDIAYWMSDQDWWNWNGSPAPLPSDDVRAYVFNGGINRNAMNKSTAALNRAKRQVRFWYPAASATENDGGVIYHIDQMCWSKMAFGRTAASDAELLSTPVSTDVNGYIYYDETGTDANGTALNATLQMGLMDISNGDRNADVFGFIPDFQTLTGEIDLTVQTSYYPSDDMTASGPYAITANSQRQDLRADGKLFSFFLQSNVVGGNFRIGITRLDVSPAGARR